MDYAGYVEFFFTEDEAIDHCRKRNQGKASNDPDCYAVVDGPGCTSDHPDDCNCCDYAVVDLETARELLDYPDSGIAPLIVTN